MAGNTFGVNFSITTFGESHGPVIGVVVDGCPGNLDWDEALIDTLMARRRPGQSVYSTARQETDQVELLSGVFEGKTTGAPIAMLIRNSDARSGDYEALKQLYRPSHADFTWEQRYGHRDYRGSGRSSARETAARVAGGAVAMMWLRNQNISIKAMVSGIGTIDLPGDPSQFDPDAALLSPIYCPDVATSKQIEADILAAKEAGDSLGGRIFCRIDGLPSGIGNPVFDKLEARLAQAMLSINACKGFESGSGFAGSYERGSIHNDAFYRDEDGAIRTKTNRSGGIQGGISNGMPVTFRVAFKPTATIQHEQQTVNREGQEVVLSVSGRHDPCVVPRAVVIVEAMAALVVADLLKDVKRL